MQDPRYIKRKSGTPPHAPQGNEVPENPMELMLECYADIAEYLRIIALYHANKGVKEGIITQDEADGNG